MYRPIILTPRRGWVFKYLYDDAAAATAAAAAE